MNSVRHFGLAHVAVIAALLLPALAEAATVVASRGPSAATYPVGRRLDASARLVLAAGDQVTVLDERGTRIVRGPGSFPVAAQAAGDTRQNVFTSLVQDRTTVRVRTGSVRNGPNGEPPRSPNLWYVDVSRPGTYCVVDPAHLRLWRPAMGTATTLTVKSPTASTPISFAASDMVAPWDATALPIKVGTSYEMLDADGKTMGTLSIKLIAEAPKDMEATAAVLIEQGCTQQLDLLSSSVQLPES